MDKDPLNRYGFVHLHARSHFSLLSGLPSPEALAAKAKALGFRALALTDTNRMSGLIRFHKECRALGIRPVLGAELDEAARPGVTVVLLVRNADGYGDLCELISRRQMRPSEFTFAQAFSRDWPNLIFLTAFERCLRVLAESPNAARLYGELVRHSPESRARSRGLETLCGELGLPVAASGDCHFLERADFELHRVVRAIDLNSTLSRLRPGETAPEGAWLQGPAAMEDLFFDRPDALRNAADIAADCDARPPMGRWIMPEIAVPRGYTPDTYLAKLACRGLWRKYGGKPEFTEARRIQEMELRVIAKLGYSSYFLMVKKIRDWAGKALRGPYRRARDCSILRGSGANSITFFNLGVCNLDPIALNLYFQRFLNEDRAAPPDADLDFGWDERDLALKQMVKMFGRDRVAITCTTNRFIHRSAFREVAKVFGYSEAQVTAVLDSRATQDRRLDDAEIRNIEAWARRLHQTPRFLGQHPGGLIVTNQPIWRHVACEYSKRTGPDGSPGRLITQIDMHNGIDELGLIKFDLLGNGSLSVLRDALAQIHAAKLPDPEVWDVQKCFRDPDVRKMIGAGRTRGIFYIESPAQMRLNQKAGAETFAEIVITSSLIRPAGTAYCKTFVERHRDMKQGIRNWEYLHPSLQRVLAETHDVCAFQEDVIRICHEIAGLSFKLSDRIRKMMNSQHEGAPEQVEWAAIRRAFIEGCGQTQGMESVAAEELWKRVSSFSGFSFCKSHSASYAELSFQCAHLKAHFPAQFLSSVISNHHGFYTRDVYLDEARRCGLRILPLDINASRLQYFGKDDWIRPGLLPVRHCREAALKVMVQEREAEGPFLNLPDLLRRVPLHKREAENLILAGGMGCFGMTQPELLYLLDAVYGKAGDSQVDLFAPQGHMEVTQGRDVAARDATAVSVPAPAMRDAASLAASPAESAIVAAKLFDVPALREYPLMQRCLNELRMLGYVLSANLLDVVEDHALARDAVRATDLGRHVGRRVKVFGIPMTDRLHPVAGGMGEYDVRSERGVHSERGDRGERYMKFLTLGDKTGTVDVIFWPQSLERWNDVLVGQVPFSGNLLEIWGKVSEDSGTYSVEADSVRVAEWLPNQVNFELASRRLREGLKNYPTYAGAAARSAGPQRAETLAA